MKTTPRSRAQLRRRIERIVAILRPMPPSHRAIVEDLLIHTCRAFVAICARSQDEADEAEEEL